VRRHIHLGDSKLLTTVGIQARSDSIANALYHDRARVRLQDREKADIGESELSYEPAPVTGIHYSPGWPRTIMA
jgi:hypothetical protein